jgi:hypothetical protein
MPVALYRKSCAARMHASTGWRPGRHIGIAPAGGVDEDQTSSRPRVGRVVRESIVRTKGRHEPSGWTSSDPKARGGEPTLVSWRSEMCYPEGERRARHKSDGSSIRGRESIVTVRIQTTLPGVDQEQFDAIHAIITAGEPPKGLLFHSSAPIEGGWLVIDFWGSREEYDAAMPVVQQAIQSSGVTPQGPPSVEEFPVHEIFQP